MSKSFNISMIHNLVLLIKDAHFRKYHRQKHGKRLFFCINSGRSGSEYLSQLLGTAKHVHSFHEPEPKMIGPYLQMVIDYTYTETFNKRRIKSQKIIEILDGMPSWGIYCETNHMFIKTFFDVILEDFENVEVIILRREISMVLKSFIELGYFSSKNSAWHKWMISPNAKTAALPCIAKDSVLDQYDLAIAYLLDIEARAQRFKKNYPEIECHEIRLESLNRTSSVLYFLKELNLVPTPATLRIIGKKINIRNQNKNISNNSVDISYCKHRIIKYIEKATALGISIPKTLALEP